MSGTKPKGSRSVLVTGGSRGLGLAIAQKLAAGGYCTIAVARKKNKSLAAAMAHADRAGRGALHFVSFALGRVDANLRWPKSGRRSIAAAALFCAWAPARARSCMPMPLRCL
jgi:3-oxoacyl-[acyl-carrier protein] reductase